jgi:hypothetical protein
LGLRGASGTRSQIQSSCSSVSRIVMRTYIARRNTGFGIGSSLEDKFSALEEEWREYNAGRSTIEFNHFAYYQIMGIGPAAIPLLLKRVEQGANAWFVALKAIGGASAASDSTRGNPKAARDAWLEWGRIHGYRETGAFGSHQDFPLLPTGPAADEPRCGRLEER